MNSPSGANATVDELVDGYPASITDWYASHKDMELGVYTQFERLTLTLTLTIILTLTLTLPKVGGDPHTSHARTSYSNLAELGIQAGTKSHSPATGVDGEEPPPLRILVVDGMTQLIDGTKPGLVCAKNDKKASRYVEKIENILDHLFAMEATPIAIISLCCESFRVAQ